MLHWYGSPTSEEQGEQNGTGPDQEYHTPKRFRWRVGCLRMIQHPFGFGEAKNEQRSPDVRKQNTAAPIQRSAGFDSSDGHQSCDKATLLIGGCLPC